MKIIRADFKKDCTIFELSEKLLDSRLVGNMDEYLEERDYTDEYPDYMLLNSRGNIAEFMNTESGEKIFMGLYYDNDHKRLELLTPMVL